MQDLIKGCRLGLTASVSLLCWTIPVYAQSTETRDDTVDIVVTARRVEERLQDVPISISVFNQQQLSNRNIVTASDLATYTPSLSTNSRFGSDNSSFAIRGFVQDQGTAPSVGVYFADVVALRAASGTTVGNGAGVGAYFDLANVQVLKGPQGTLFGRNTTGGAVLLVPQKPTGRLEGYIEGSVGNYDLRRVQAVVNVPVMDTLRVRLGVDRQTRDGYLINHSGIGPRDFSDVDYTALRLSIVADLTPNLENYTVLTYSKSNTNGFLPRLTASLPMPDGRTISTVNGVPITGLAPIAGPFARQQLLRQSARGDGYYDVENAVVDALLKVEQWQIINTTTWKATDALTIKNVASYGQYRQQQRGAVFGENFYAAGGTPFNIVQSIPYPGLDSASQSTFTEELQFQGSVGSRLQWQAGGYAELSEPLNFSGSLSPTGSACPDTNVYNCTVVIPGVSALGSRYAKNTFHDLGAYGQATYKITDRLSATAGIRYTYDYTKVVARQTTYQSFVPGAKPPLLGTCTNTLAFGTAAQGNVGKTDADCETPFTQKSKKPTWLIGIDYKPTEDLLIYAKYARGYRQGGVNPYAPGLYTFEPEKLDSYEAGIKANFSGAVRGHLNVAGFYNDFSNQQLAIGGNPCTIGSTCNGFTGANPGRSPTSAILNAGQSRVAGVEVDGSIIPFKGLTLDVGYAYLDTKLKSITFPAVNAFFQSYTLTSSLPGLPLVLSPKNKVSVTGTYMLPFDESIGRIALSATFTHTDSMQSTYSDYGPEVIGLVGYDPSRIPATDLLNLNLNWSNIAGRPVDLSVFATNVTNERYPAFSLGVLSNFGFASEVPAPPRMYGLRLRYRFGQ